MRFWRIILFNVGDTKKEDKFESLQKETCSEFYQWTINKEQKSPLFRIKL